jgi:L-ascorbate metabolism protein UlaG (beta-lactamase superfamily)
LIDDNLLIDAGPDLPTACSELGVSLLSLRYLALTHAHFDHFYPENLEIRGPRYRAGSPPASLTVVAPGSCLAVLNRIGLSDDDLAIQRVCARPDEEISLPPYVLKPMLAEHAKGLGDAVNYLVQKEDFQLLYAVDTGLYSEATLRKLAGARVDLLIMDATNGFKRSSPNHLNHECFAAQLQRLRERKVIFDETVVVATHFSHWGNPPHEELSLAYSSLGVLCAFDGLVLPETGSAGGRALP